jgi:phage terminase large subunit-like protein
MNEQLRVLRNKFISLSEDKKSSFIKSLTKSEQLELYKYPEFFLFDKQIIEPGNWRYKVLLCGRGFGKSTASSAWLYRKILEGHTCLGVCVPTYGDLMQVMIPAIMKWSPPNDKPNYNQKERTLSYSNGAKIHCYSSEVELRGPNFSFLAADEIVKWCDGIPEKIQTAFDTLDFAVRIGDNPQILISTTPKPIPIIQNWVKLATEGDPLYSLTTGSIFDNLAISEKAKQSLLAKHAGTRLGRQELFGELLTEVEGALFNQDNIDKYRITTTEFLNNIKPNLERIVVAVDPSISDGSEGSDACGIVVAGLYKNRIYIMEDLTLHAPPNKWAEVAVKAYKSFRADKMVVEINQGGLMVEGTIRTVDSNVAIHKVHAKQSKMVRAEPVAALYQQGKVAHVGTYQQLEREMTTFTGSPKQKSPNRLDALVYAATNLLIERVYTNRSFDNIGYY